MKKTAKPVKLGYVKTNAVVKYGVLASGILVVALIAYFFRPETQSPEVSIATHPHTGIHDTTSVAIASFVNLGGNPQNDYLAYGVEDTILTELSRLSQLSVMRLPGSQETTAEYQYVLEGSILQSGYQLRIDTRLVNATTGVIL